MGWIGVLPTADQKMLNEVIDSAHRLGKLVRFWAAPDTKSAWLTQISLGADVIGTDKIKKWAFSLKGELKNSSKEISAWVKLLPAIIHCTTLALITLLAPLLSL